MPSKNLTFGNIKSVIKTSFLDWRGKICAVLFLGGCNFRCPYCHNKELVICPQEMENVSFDEVTRIIMKNPDWIDGVVITGGEPTLDPELIPLIEAIRDMDLLVKIDTNGSCPHILESLIERNLIYYIAMDFKAPLEKDVYALCSGINSPPISKIKQSIDLLLQNKVDYEFRVTLCPSLLGEREILAMAHSIKGARRFTLQNFRAHATLDPNFENERSYSKNELNRFRELILPFVQECNVIAPHQP
ncbi:MAG: anaerobic ribonucleoside-triphosphate reductase activating protein [bacterium]